jgi:predicted amidohydrolase
MLRIAVVQQDHNPGKPEENRRKALAAAAGALEQGAVLVLFHEELLLGYTTRVRELAEPLDGPTTRAFRDLLRGSSSLVVYGLTERDGEDCYIAAPVVSADGVIASYRKTHLWWDAGGLRHEPTFYKPGNTLVTFAAGGHDVGIMICYDGDFPEMTRAYADRGCAMVLWPNNRESRGHEEVRDHAARNSMIIAAACCCGTDEAGNACRGGSNVTDADGKLLAEIWDREGTVVADVDLDRAIELRGKNPWYRGRRPELYR